VATLIDGKAISKIVREEVARGVEAFKAQYSRVPGLHVVLVGEDPASDVYVRSKEKAALEVGIAGRVHRLPESTTEETLLGLIKELNQSGEVDGILVQFPVPKGIRQQKVVEATAPSKDVDGLHPQNIGALFAGVAGLQPCTPRGCMRLIAETGVRVEGAKAVVVGRSNLVGKPVAGLLLAANATVTLTHSKTQDLPSICREADILVVAVGRAKLIPGTSIKPGAVVIDVGMNRDEAGKLCGDVDFEAASAVASAITPVPGGVGPMTIAMLLENTLLAAQARLTRASRTLIS